MDRRTLIAAGLAAAFTAGPMSALAAIAKTLTPEDRGLVDKAAAYIQSLKTVSAKFTQIAPSGSTSTGIFYMQRPGKARFQYDAPAAMLIVSDGTNVSVSDDRLKTFDRYPLGRTPLNLLLAREVRLDRGVAIGRVDRTPGGFSITATDGLRQADGRLIMYFSDAPISLRGWTVIDAQGGQTRVQLGDLSPADGLSPDLFILRDPRRTVDR